MKEKLKKTKHAKKLFKWSDEKILKLKPSKKQKAARLAAGFIILLSIAAAGIGFMAVDHNSLEVGWSDSRTELAFAYTTNRLNITLIGQKYYIDTSLVTKAEKVYAQVSRGFNYLEPSPLRVIKMYYIFFREKVKNLNLF